MVRRVLVTGGCGFVSRHVVQELPSANDNVRIQVPWSAATRLAARGLAPARHGVSA